MQDQSVPVHILPLIVISQFAGCALWFAPNAVMDLVALELGVANQGVAAVTAAVQLGFIAGTLFFAFTALPDRLNGPKLFFGCIIVAATLNALVTLLPLSFVSMLLTRFGVGFAIAGIYPIGMKIAATWYDKGLGRSLAWLIAALVVGTAAPHLVRAFNLSLDWRFVLWVLSALSVAGGLLLWLFIPEGPHKRPGARFDPQAVIRAFRSPRFRASALGYFGHVWEVYAFWVFVPFLLAAYSQSQGDLALSVPVWSFLIIAIGALGSIVAGTLSPRLGTGFMATSLLSVSFACCLALPLAFQLPPWAFLAYLLIWGAFVAGDSGLFSALNAQSAPPAYAGSALTMVLCIGFALSVISIPLPGLVANWISIEHSFWLIALGPAIGIWAMKNQL